MPNGIPSNEEEFRLYVVDHLSSLTEGQKNINVRLFGDNGQTGALRYMTDLCDKIHKESKDRDAELEKKHDALDDRVSSLGNKVWYMSGASSVLGAVLTFLGIHFRGQ